MHPGFPPKPVYDTYYADLGPILGLALSTAMWGFHVDTGMHTLRLILCGVFDRFPNLHVIIGHMGEATPFMMGRIEERLGGLEATLAGFDAPFKRPIRDYFKTNIHITTSGFFVPESLRCSIEALGADRILLAVDYPFSPNSAAREFIDSVEISEADREAISHGNADRLLKLST
jgi:predicted TIM-barrel fold metal-dependent hydrolase